MSSFEPTPRTELKRSPDRGRFDAKTIYAILDEGLVAHVGFPGQESPVVIPTAYCRIGDTLYVHGSPANQMLRTLEKGLPVCVTVTLLDGIIFARSAFHMSMNYRSVVIFGTAQEVNDPDEALRAYQALVDHVAPGRWPDVREPNEYELTFTKLLSLPIETVSAKVRTGGPNDEADDLNRPGWAGVVPLALTPSAPIAAEDMVSDVAAPEYATGYRRPSG